MSTPFRPITNIFSLQYMIKIMVLLHAGRVQSNLIKLYCIVYRYLYSVSHGISQTEALAVGLSSKKRVRLKTRERRGMRSRENRKMKKSIQRGGSKEKDQYISVIIRGGMVQCTIHMI